MTVTIYTLTNPETGLIFYVGKTALPLAQRQINGWSAPTYHYLKSKGVKPIMEVVDTCMKDDWQFWEKWWMGQVRAWGFEIENAERDGTWRSKHRIAGCYLMKSGRMREVNVYDLSGYAYARDTWIANRVEKPLTDKLSGFVRVNLSDDGMMFIECTDVEHVPLKKPEEILAA